MHNVKQVKKDERIPSAIYIISSRVIFIVYIQIKPILYMYIYEYM